MDETLEAPANPALTFPSMSNTKVPVIDLPDDVDDMPALMPLVEITARSFA